MGGDFGIKMNFGVLDIYFFSYNAMIAMDIH